MPKVSIIVPVYKTEQFLCRCIDSILAQTFTDIEVILIDDGSPDGCPIICDEYKAKDSRVKVIHQKNSGVSAARNAGIRICSGEYLLFVDSDDYIASDMIKNLHSAIEKKYDIAISGYAEINQNKFIEVHDYKFCTCKDDFLLHCIQNTGGVVCSKLYRTSLIRENNITFDERLVQSEDLIFALNVFLKTDKFIVIDKAEYFYDRSHENIKNIDPLEFLNKNLIVQDLIMKIFNNQNIPNKAEVLKKRLSNIIYIYLLTLVQNEKFKRFQQSRAYLKKRIDNLDFKEFDIFNRLWLSLYKKDYCRAAYLICNVRLLMVKFLKKCLVRKG